MTNLMLFATLGFFEGMGRTLDLRGTMVGANESLSPKEADASALLSDWMTVGQDIETAIEKYEQELEKA
ncbi:MAG: hypothetical protein FJ121_12330 [Deltaproteobacteria bacterium]|nr:hypothetical protein [Deltaproteobacteria bacterium]